MALIQVEPNIWVIPGTVKFSKNNSMPCRATLVRLSDDTLWLHSPVKLTDEDVEQIKALGEVAYIVAPNTYHHLFYPQSAAHFPNAQTWATEGLDIKRADITFSHQLGRDDAPWAEDMDTIMVEGAPKLNEWTFFHKPSKSLIVTDVIFNIKPSELSTGVRILMRVFGAYDIAAQSRTWRLLVKDRDAHQRSLQALIALPIERLIVAHGDIIEEDARERTEAALTRGLSKFTSKPKPSNPS